MEAPLGVLTEISRDLFGKPRSITRSGPHASGPVSVTRSYVYDQYQQLCKQVEPETGSTVVAYDAAGNVDWSAAGLNLPSATSCDASAVAEAEKVRRVHDSLNRLDTLTFPDGLGNQDWDYTPDGLPSSITTQNAGGVNVSNVYQYNRLRMLSLERVGQSDGLLWEIVSGYSPLGHLQQTTYPSGLAVNYAPNALGQATRAGEFATGVTYWPNGGIKAFTYGNGLVHTTNQNVRGMPESRRDAFDASVPIDETYLYDQNGNVEGIADKPPGYARRAGHDL
ncbi:MAG: hypothetical protein HC794_03350 [Nitrospiraceae bacterium]|nr:hypothetical protein [Nitrospiraceae bacterium]